MDCNGKINIKPFVCRLFCGFLFVLLIGSASAQHSFSGIVTDTEQEALTGVQVLLFANDTLYAGALTDSAGVFSLRGIHAGDYLLRLSYPGFTSIEEDRQVKGEMKYTFILEKEMAIELSGVEVVANRSDQVKRTATGQIFRLSELAKSSGNPYLALREIPRLTVNDALRTILMEDGTAPLILINGMTVNSGVAPINPKDIESVEIMDVLHARYLRTGAKHILNIKLKEKRERYTFFEVMTRHDLPLRRGLGAVYFEVGNSTYSLYGRGSGNYIYDDNIESNGWQRGDRYFKQSQGKGQTDGHTFLGELLFKWMVTPKDYIAAHVYGTEDDKTTKNEGDGFYQTDTEQAFDYRSRNRNKTFVGTGSLYHRHLFSSKELIETTLAFNYNRNNSKGNRHEDYSDWLYNYLYEYKNKRLSGSLNLDYAKEWNEVNSLNLGSETNFTNDNIRQVSENTPTFHHREWNQYFYASFSSRIKKVYYMGSVGVESIWLKAGSISGNYVKPRVSTSLTYVMNEPNSLQLSYKLVNEAPSISQLNPYNTSTDSLVIIRGNPGLLPMQEHEASLSYTFNKAGFYMTPYVGYHWFTDVIEPVGYSENNIYISTYQNSGKFRVLLLGGSASYRIGSWGRVYASGYHFADYFSGSDSRKSFSYAAGMNARYKKWMFAMDCNFRNYTYTAVSRTKYHAPEFSMLQIQYNFTPAFYVSVAMQYFTGAVRNTTETYNSNYHALLSERFSDMNVRPWILLRYTLRKNDKQKIKLNNIVSGKEKGISL